MAKVVVGGIGVFMTLKSEIQNVARQLEEIAEEAGSKGVDPKRVANVLKDVLERPSVSSEYYSAKTRARFELWLQTRLEMTRGVLSFGQTAIRSLLLVNGGAAVALLTFLGGLLETKPDIAAAMAFSLVYFSSGVFFGALVAATSYLTQFMYDYSVKRVSRVGIGLHIAALLFALLSLVCFFRGAYVAYLGLTSGVA